MKNIFFGILRGWLFWCILRARYRINYKKVVLVLTGDNEGVDNACITNLSKFVKRKFAEEAIIFCLNECLDNYRTDIRDYNWKFYCMESEKMDLLYGFYAFTKFFDNIVFTYIDNPKDNYLGRYLRETDVTAEDAACLALYHLRYVPNVA